MTGVETPLPSAPLRLCSSPEISTAVRTALADGELGDVFCSKIRAKTHKHGRGWGQRRGGASRCLYDDDDDDGGGCGDGDDFSY